MADLRDLESLRVVSEDARDRTVPPRFDDLLARARRRRRRRTVATGVLAAAVATVVGGVALLPGTSPESSAPDTPVATDGQRERAAALAPADPRAVAVVESGILHSFATDQRGDRFGVWASCPDPSSCRYAWQLVRADGRTTAGLYPADTGGPHATAGPDYFVATWYDGPQLLVADDGATTRLTAASAGAEPAPGSATVVTTGGVALADRDSGHWLAVDAPTGRPWNTLDVADDGTLWGADQPGTDPAAVVAHRPPGGAWEQEPLRGPGTGVLVRSGDRVAALALDAPAVGGDVTVPSSGVPTDYAVTTDGGATWRHLAAADLPFTSLESWAATADGTLVVSDGVRVWRTTDDGWTRFAEVPGAGGLNRLSGDDLAHPDRVYGYSYDDDRLVVVTSSGQASVATHQLR